MSDLYQVFYARFPEDSQFWWNLSMEELNHASLIRSINDLFLPEKILPAEGIEIQTEKIREVNNSILNRIKNYKTENLIRYEAFRYASDLENSFGEIHFELFMNGSSESHVHRIFQKLNGEDKNHALRISDYMKLNNIT